MNGINSNTNTSFIIPAFNCQDTIAETVASIFNSNFSEGDEVIIINDASTDDTLRIGQALQQQHPSIIIINHRINKGTAAASRNTGIEQAYNNLIFCLDADNVLAPNSIPGLRKYLLENKADAASFGEIHFFKEVEGQKKLVYQTQFKSGMFTLADALSTNYFIGQSGNYLFTRESWLKAGRYFEPTLINQTLDSWTFTIRQLGTGAKLVKMPHTYYLHRRTPNSHWTREIKKGNVSLAALTGLMPFLDLIEDEDVEYMMGKEGRYTWFDDLEKRPIQLKSGEKGQGAVKIIQKNEHIRVIPLWKRVIKAAVAEIRK